MASTFSHVDDVWVFTFWLCAFFFLLITGLLLYSVIRYRRRHPNQPAASKVTHNTTLEVVWTVVPLVIMMVLFAWGWKGAMDMTMPPADSLQYQAKGKQWEWQIFHPDSDSPTVKEMWVPVNTNVKVTLWSDDVLHAFFVPAFRIKRDVLPGRYQTVWFRATREGDYHLMCAEYCGTNHSYMLGTVHVVSKEVFATKPWNVHPEEPTEWGAWIVKNRCSACHTVDGRVLIGPSFKGIWGREEAMEDGGTVVVDRAYVVESLREPQKRIVKGFAGKGNMTPFPASELKDEEIEALSKYFESIK